MHNTAYTCSPLVTISTFQCGRLVEKSTTNSKENVFVWIIQTAMERLVFNVFNDTGILLLLLFLSTVFKNREPWMVKKDF